MHAPLNPLMLGAGVLFAGLFVRMMLRGSIHIRCGVVERATNPVGFWLVAAANAVIVVAAFLIGFGVLKR